MSRAKGKAVKRDPQFDPWTREDREKARGYGITLADVRWVSPAPKRKPRKKA